VTLAQNATYEVASAASQVGTLAVAGSLRLGEGSSLVLTGAASSSGAKLIGAGNVIAGNTLITGGGNDGWQAGDTGKVVIGPNSIGAADAAVAASLTAQGTVNAPKITVGAASTFTIGAKTTIALGVESGPAAVGTIVLTKPASGSTTLAFTVGAPDSSITASADDTPVASPSIGAGGVTIGNGLTVNRNSGALASITSKAVGDGTIKVDSTYAGNELILGAATTIGGT
jgi:hypothetical protein